ncbi:MAG: hypothetical protein JWR07_4072 [Nevskia sp.]|nr:hypothetical protein [Nevskia sp.]
MKFYSFTAMVLALACVSGCASVHQRDYVTGFGGMESKTDTFSGAAVKDTGKGFLVCAGLEGRFCLSGYSMSFHWSAETPNIIVVSAAANDARPVVNLEINNNHVISQLKSNPASGAAAAGKFQLTLAEANSLLASQYVLIRATLSDGKVPPSTDFNRHMPGPGQVTAKDMLSELVSQIESQANAR